jgi:CheY-like chemotaxis protein
MRISPRPLNLAPVVEAALDTARPAALAKDIALSLAADNGAGAVQADPVRMQQIVWNLVSNAIKFTPKRGRVQVALERAGSRVRLTVADTGLGIAPDKLPYVFERFWQDTTQVAPENVGLGLGLAICRSLVELHGGSIRAESDGVGKGAVFVAEFPVMVAAAGEAPTHHGVQPASQAPSLEGVDVLVVDDDADARGLLRMLLESAGARVETAASVDEALLALARAAPHVIVSDVGMPGRDGYALIRDVRAADPRATVAAIAITGLGRPQDRIDLLRAGFQAHLVKPVEPDELVALVRTLTRR